MGNIFGRVHLQMSVLSRALIFGSLAVGLGFYLAHPQYFTPAQTGARKDLVSQQTNIDAGQSYDLGDCTLRYLPQQDTKSAALQIARDGKVLLIQKVSAGEFKLLSTDGADNLHNIYTVPLAAPAERDVVAEITDARDQHQYLVIRLSKDLSKTQAPRIVAKLKTGKSCFLLLDGGKDNLFALSASDHLEGWGAEAVAPTINYHLLNASENDPENARLKPFKDFVDKKLLKENVPELQAQFADLMVSEDAPITFAPASLADEMASLVYAGHKEEAIQLLDDAWPKHESVKKKKLFWAAFLKELQKSPNWPAVKELNNGLE